MVIQQGDQFRFKLLVRQSYCAKVESKRVHSFLRNATNRNTVDDLGTHYDVD